ncbi:MAG TPA: pentapeptide repeat-containing protein, partial [Solirubrobacteraceae bacterium]|nr:pentapeptide repeat-containing protein [Solirubrobacteraceae bacterium]
MEPALIASPQAPRFDDEPVDVTDLEDGAEGARLVDADLSGAKLRGVRLLDVIVERGNFANAVAPEGTMRRVVITGARLTGLQWTRGTIGDAVFRDCRIDLATFAGTTFERV